jgi:hypothetical protein
MDPRWIISIPIVARAVGCMSAPSTVARRQARIQSHAVILPRGIDAGRWYDIVPGRRHNDQRPGMVLLDLGSSMLHFPERCLEYRDAEAHGASADGAAPRKRRRRGMWALSSRHLAIAASLVPVGVAAVFAGRTLLGDR